MTDELTRIASGYSFLEGPRWRSGELICSDFYTNRVVAFGNDGCCREVAKIEGQPSGIGFTANSELLVVSMLDRRIVRVSHREIASYADLGAATDNFCNDMLVDPHGNAFVGTFAWRGDHSSMLDPTDLLLARPDGSVSIAASNLIFPNGMAISNDGKLLVAETFAARITAFQVSSDGRLGESEVWADLGSAEFSSIEQALRSGAVLPDGIAVTEDGGLWIADAAGEGAFKIEKGGRIVDHVRIPKKTVYAVAVGGARLDTLFMCAAEPLLTVDPATTHRSELWART